ncbi:MAG: hypothetical protein AAGC47_10225 [Bacteroidota bacterium]
MRKALIFITLLISTLSFGQNREQDQFSFGFHLNRIQDEFGFGIGILSPELKFVQISAKGNINWLNHLDEEGLETWSECASFQLGLRTHNQVADRIALYAEGGGIGLLPNSDFSSSSFEVGGYGLFGFEFYLTEGIKRNPCYFIEIGGAGLGARADKLLSEPIYANGFLVVVGYRF